MNRTHRIAFLLPAVLLAGCGSPDQPAAGDAAGTSPPVSAAAGTTGAPAAAADRRDAGPPAQASSASQPAIAGRTGELVNPENAAVVLLYYDLAGLALPLNDWIERDSRVSMAQPIDKGARREEVRAELDAAAAAVKDIGFLRVTMDANLSDYDPIYSEFQVRALAPSSVVNYEALDRKVGLRFTNGRDARIWKVAPEEAQLIRDKVGSSSRGVELDALLRITGVQPAPQGGTINTEVVEYELRQRQSGNVLARIRL